MGQNYTNNTKLTGGFSYDAARPLDDRISVQTVADLSTLVSSNKIYDGMIVAVTNDETDANNGAYIYLPVHDSDPVEYHWVMLSTGNIGELQTYINSLQDSSKFNVINGGNASSKRS